MSATLHGMCMLTADIDSPTGGVQAQSFRLLRALTARGIAASVCTRNYHHLSRDEVHDGIRIHRSPVATRALRACNSGAYLADAMSWLLRHRADFDVLHCQQMFGPAMAALLSKPLVGKPVVVRVSSTGDLGEVADVRRLPLSSLRIRQLQQVDHWVALTRVMAAEICSLGVPDGRITVIPNAAVVPAHCAADPQTRERYRRHLGLGYDQIVLYSGRLSSEKNLDVLLRAWAEVRRTYPAAHLLLAGAGGAFRNIEPDLRRLVDDLAICESVHFLGHVPSVNEYLLAADVFVLPTSTEGMSNALLEAMAAGVAVVTTDIEPNREVVVDGEHALLVPPRAAGPLAGAISCLLDSHELAARLGSCARNRVCSRHRVEQMADAYVAVYRDVITAAGLLKRKHSSAR